MNSLQEGRAYLVGDSKRRGSGIRYVVLADKLSLDVGLRDLNLSDANARTKDEEATKL